MKYDVLLNNHPSAISVKGVDSIEANNGWLILSDPNGDVVAAFPTYTVQSVARKRKSK